MSTYTSRWGGDRDWKNEGDTSSTISMGTALGRGRGRMRQKQLWLR